MVVAALLGANVAAFAQDSDTPNYFVIAQNTQENTITNGGRDGQQRTWWGYDAFNRNMDFSFEGHSVDDLYIQFDLYVESPLAEDGLAFPGIEWGCPLDDGFGKMENQNYININLKSASGNWTFADMGPAMNTAYGDIFDKVKDREWNTISLPLSQSPNLSKLDLSTQFNGFSLQFARMKAADYVFKLKNLAIVDHSKVTVNEIIPTPYTYVQPSSDTKECSFVLGGDPKTSAYITLNIDHVDLSAYSNIAFNFVVEVTPVDGEEDPALLGNITGAGGQGVILGSKVYNEIADWGKEAAGYYAIKSLDWKFGKHVYSVPVSSMNNLNVVDWADIQTGRLYIYDDVTTLGKINVKFTDFYFTGDVIKDIDGGDDTTGIEEVVLGADTHVTIYNLGGVQVFSGVYGEAQLPAGLYVVVDANGSRKVMF